MAYTFIDKFSGTANASLNGHTSDVGGATWSNGASYSYNGGTNSNFAFDGNGYVYCGVDPSVWILPYTLASATHEHRFTLIKRSVASPTQAAGTAFFVSDAATLATNYHVRWYENGAGAKQFELYRNGGAAVATGGLILTIGQPYEVRVRVTDGSPRAITVDYSADDGQTWTNAITYSDATPAGVPTTGHLNVALWANQVATAITGLAVGNLRIGANPTTPGLTVSPTSITVGTAATITLTGSGTAWTAGTPGTPVLTLSGGTGAALSAQTLTGVDAGTVTLAAGSATGPLTITDPSGGTATITVNPLMLAYDSLIRGAATGQTLTSAAITPRSWNGTSEATPSGTTIGTPVETDVAGTYICRLSYPSNALPVGTIPLVKWVVSTTTYLDNAPVPNVPPNVTVGGYALAEDPASLLLVTPANKIATDAGNRVSANTTQFGGQAVVLDAGNFPSVNVADVNGTTATPATIPTAAQNATAWLTDLLTSTDFNTTGSVGAALKSFLNAVPLSQIPVTVVADAANSTTVVTVSGLSGLSAGALTFLGSGKMQVQWTGGTADNLALHAPITGAVVNGSNVKLTVSPAFGTAPAVGDTGVIR